MSTYIIIPAPGHAHGRATISAVAETEKARDAALRVGQGRLMAAEVDPEWGHASGDAILMHDYDRPDVLARAWRWHEGRIVRGPVSVERVSNRPRPAVDPRYL